MVGMAPLLGRIRLLLCFLAAGDDVGCLVSSLSTPAIVVFAVLPIGGRLWISISEGTVLLREVALLELLSDTDGPTDWGAVFWFPRFRRFLPLASRGNSIAVVHVNVIVEEDAEGVDEEGGGAGILLLDCC